MIRPVTSYVLTLLILVSQLGLPLHMHYCKGILESVSVFFAAKCDDHNVPVNLPSCCKKSVAEHCTKKDQKKCCDDEVIVLKQDITSTTPSFVKWIDATAVITIPFVLSIEQAGSFLEISEKGIASDSGPPVYIRYHSLIFYA